MNFNKIDKFCAIKFKIILCFMDKNSFICLTVISQMRKLKLIKFYIQINRKNVKFIDLFFEGDALLNDYQINVIYKI